MEMVFVPPLQTLLHPPLLFRWEGQGELVQSQAVLKYTALITQTTSYDSAIGLASHKRRRSVQKKLGLSQEWQA